MSEQRTRLPIETFDIPVNEIRRGYRSAIYFWRAKKILEKHKPDQLVTMQIFQKNNAVLCGMDEALAIVRTCTGYWKSLDKVEKLFDDYMDLKQQVRHARMNWKGFGLPIHAVYEELLNVDLELDNLWVDTSDLLDVRALFDGDEIAPWETVAHVKGALASFVHLESVYLGVLARRTKVATNVQRVVQAANDKPVLFFADRFDHYATQGGDGYAAHVGGAQGIATEAMGRWWGEPGMGTMPHALIAAFGGDTVGATIAFHDTVPEANVVSLVDFNNNCVGTTLNCLDEFGDKLWGVRLDTSENMIDSSIEQRNMGDFKPTGVNAQLVHNVRDALDREGGQHVKIIVSGGFNVEKIKAFEAVNVPVDSYAVGSSLLQGAGDFTADVVQPASKMGRWFRPNERLVSAW
jgi:nicotinate phosphoribosyltransferase